MEKKFQKWILEDERGKRPGQKFKSLLVMQYILKYADDEHPVTIADIEGHLLKYGIEAEQINPSVKNQRFLPAPFTQGSLWVLPHQCVYRCFSEKPENCTTFYGFSQGDLLWEYSARTIPSDSQWCSDTGPACARIGCRLCRPRIARRGSRPRESACPPADRCSWHRNAPPSSHTGFPDSKSAGCPSPDP